MVLLTVLLSTGYIVPDEEEDYNGNTMTTAVDHGDRKWSLVYFITSSRELRCSCCGLSGPLLLYGYGLFTGNYGSQ